MIEMQWSQCPDLHEVIQMKRGRDPAPLYNIDMNYVAPLQTGHLR